MPWPYHALGRVRIVRRERGILFAASGLSFPFDESVHGPNREPLGFELGIELPTRNLPDTSAEALGAAWPVRALLWLSACYVVDAVGGSGAHAPR